MQAAVGAGLWTVTAEDENTLREELGFAPIEEEDREVLRVAGFSERDIFDIAAVASFYNMSNRMASATDMRPNAEYHRQAR